MTTPIDVPQGYLNDLGDVRNRLVAFGRFAGTFLLKADLQALESFKRKHGHGAITIEGPGLWVFDTDSAAGASGTVLVPSDNPTSGRWVQVGGGGGGSTGSVTWSGNRAIDLREATGVGPTVAAVGSDAGATNQTLTGGGLNLTVDLAIGTNVDVEALVIVKLIDTSDSNKARYLNGRIFVQRGAGAPVITSPSSTYHLVKTVDDNASIYSTDIQPVALYGAPSISGNNLRITVTNHATHNQKANVDIFAFVTPNPT